jgi:phosphatidylserine/phosphatidylglycerophosphate/cardiolipin synthase-like enzyme
MVTRAFIQAMMEARRRFTATQWDRFVNGLDGCGDADDNMDVAALLPDVVNSDALWLLNRGLRLRGSCSWAQVAAVLAAVDVCGANTVATLTPVWTGPANGLFPVRRFDQVLYDLVAQATRRILIVTFAAYRVRHLCELLADAVARGTQLTLVLEGEEESGGQLSHDALNAFQSVKNCGCTIYCWPLDRRARNAAGRPGKLHAKCAVVDDTTLVGSGNLTDDAFNRNMELGLLVNDSVTAGAIYSHFMALAERGDLRRVVFPD